MPIKSVLLSTSRPSWPGGGAWKEPPADWLSVLDLLAAWVAYKSKCTQHKKRLISKLKLQIHNSKVFIVPVDNKWLQGLSRLHWDYRFRDYRCSHTRQFLILFNLLGVFSKICRNSWVNSEQGMETEGERSFRDGVLGHDYTRLLDSRQTLVGAADLQLNTKKTDTRQKQMAGCVTWRENTEAHSRNADQGLADFFFFFFECSNVMWQIRTLIRGG